MVSKRTIFFFWEESVFTPGQLSIEFANVGGWLISEELELDSSAQFLAVAEHRSIHSRARSLGLVITLFGLLPVKIGLLVVMLGLVLSVLVVHLFLSHLVSLLIFRSFSGWVGY